LIFLDLQNTSKNCSCSLCSSQGTGLAGGPLRDRRANAVEARSVGARGAGCPREAAPCSRKTGQEQVEATGRRGRGNFYLRTVAVLVTTKASTSTGSCPRVSPAECR